MSQCIYPIEVLALIALGCYKRLTCFEDDKVTAFEFFCFWA